MKEILRSIYRTQPRETFARGGSALLHKVSIIINESWGHIVWRDEAALRGIAYGVVLVLQDGLIDLGQNALLVYTVG